MITSGGGIQGAMSEAAYRNPTHYSLSPPLGNDLHWLSFFHDDDEFHGDVCAQRRRATEPLEAKSVSSDSLLLLLM